MRRRKQIVFYAIMVVMTLAVIEGMAQAAYYIAYGEFNGQRRPAAPLPAGRAAADAAGDRPLTFERLTFERISHPYYGYTEPEAGHTLNRAEPPRREDGVVLIALLGGSVGWGVAEAFQRELKAWFRDNGIPLRPVVLELAYIAMKQPQQVMQIANTLALGGEYDIIVNLDGRNELVMPHQNYYWHGVSPFFPLYWHRQHQELTDAQRLLANRVDTLRQRERRLAAAAGARPWRWSALYGIVNRYLGESAGAQIAALNRELTVATAEYNLEKYGPVWPVESDDAVAPDPGDLSRIALRVWYRSSALLHDLAAAAGAEYHHFQQPNQYVPNSKPLTDQELESGYLPDDISVGIYRDAYPLLRRLGDELRRQGINYHDLTQIFADNRETLYIDPCCHLNARGQELLAASMVQRLEPALRRRAALALDTAAGAANAPASATAASATAAGNTAAGPTALDAAIRESSPVHAVNKLYFDVRLNADGTLHYSRADCAADPSATARPFVVQVTPADAADLRPGRAEYGFNRYEFSFEPAGGAIDAAGRCVVEYRLPEYAIASVLTGQYDAETGQLLGPARITPEQGFEVRITDANTLRYARDNCLPIHLATEFFLHITPVDAGDLAPGRAASGFNNYDFPGVSPAEGAIDAAGGCVVERALPEYAIASINTGQYIRATGRRLWAQWIDRAAP